MVYHRKLISDRSVSVVQDLGHITAVAEKIKISSDSCVQSNFKVLLLLLRLLLLLHLLVIVVISALLLQKGGSTLLIALFR